MNSNTISKMTAILASLDANLRIISQHPLDMRVPGAFKAMNAMGELKRAASQLRAELHQTSIESAKALPPHKGIFLDMIAEHPGLADELVQIGEGSHPDFPTYDFLSAAIERAALDGGQWVLVPVEPTQAMISAMSGSRARDDEGEFPAMMDLLDFGGENKTHTVLRAAYAAMLTVRPTQQLHHGMPLESTVPAVREEIGDAQ